MSHRIRRLGFLVAITVATTGVFAVSGSQAGSLAAVSGTFTMTSDPGDYIGQGQSYAYAVPNDAIELGITDWLEVRTLVPRPSGGVLWSTHFSAPGGARLEPGTYENAQRFADAMHPGLDVSGDGRGCNTLSGRFTVLDVSYGPYDYLQSIHVTFEQHCEGVVPALRGEINLVGSEPPAPLEVQLTVDPTAGYSNHDGKIQLQGKITCSQPVQAAINGEASQTTTAGTAFSYLSFFTQSCSTAPTKWKIKVPSATSAPFVSGTLQVTLTASAVDDWYTAYHDNARFIYATDTFSGAVTAKPGG